MVAITISTLPSMHLLTEVTNAQMLQGLKLHKRHPIMASKSLEPNSSDL